MSGDDHQSTSTAHRRPREEDDEDSPCVKRSRPSPQKCSLLDLSDETLLLILQLLPSSLDLLRVAESCSRLGRVCRDRTLWIRVDTRMCARKLQTPRHLRRLIPFLHEGTDSAAFGGRVLDTIPGKETLTPSMLRELSLRCPALSELILERCFIDASKVTPTCFPSSLRRLALPGCEVANQTKESYFKDVHLSLPTLEELILRDCLWLSNHSLLSLAKCERLRSLDLCGCVRMGECFVYTALATRFGFRHLEVADLRDTNICDSEVQCFGRLPEIKTLKLGKSSSSVVVPFLAESEGDGKITDRGLLSLVSYSGDQHSSKLTSLTLAHTDVTNKILPKLITSLPLKFLDVRGCAKVNDKGARSVWQVRPHCEVLYGHVDGDSDLSQEEQSDEGELPVVILNPL